MPFDFPYFLPKKFFLASSNHKDCFDIYKILSLPPWGLLELPFREIKLQRPLLNQVRQDEYVPEDWRT